MPVPLTVAGIDLEILAAGATQSEADTVGTAKRSFSGRYRSSRRAYFDKWKFKVRPITQTEVATFLATVRANGGIHNCSGPVLGGVTVSCLVTVGAIDFIQNGGASFLRTVEISLEQAS
jgi:hypothetical protein